VIIVVSSALVDVPSLGAWNETVDDGWELVTGIGVVLDGEFWVETDDDGDSVGPLGALTVDSEGLLDVDVGIPGVPVKRVEEPSEVPVGPAVDDWDVVVGAVSVGIVLVSVVGASEVVVGADVLDTPAVVVGSPVGVGTGEVCVGVSVDFDVVDVPELVVEGSVFGVVCVTEVVGLFVVVEGVWLVVLDVVDEVPVVVADVVVGNDVEVVEVVVVSLTKNEQIYGFTLKQSCADHFPPANDIAPQMFSDWLCGSELSQWVKLNSDPSIHPQSPDILFAPNQKSLVVELLKSNPAFWLR
jgi:hypothetical protein